MQINIDPPESILNIMEVLKKSGHEAYAVGGCIRDSILGRAPKDWDIATNAKPEEVKRLFSKTVDTGLQHGTVTVLLNDEAYEVTTFRIDGDYEDGRHPSHVEFTNRIEDDLSRRDFTINAMAWNKERGIIDPFGGRADIESGMIRAVGSPDERFKEDALRMLRAVRFAARLRFDIDEATLQAMKENGKLINKVSAERIRDEINGILTADDPMKLTILRDTGILENILPEVEACFRTAQNNPHHAYNVGEHSLRAVAAIENDVCLRWTMLLHDTGKAVTRTTDEKGIDHYYGHPAKSVAIANNVLRRLRFDHKSIEKILRLIKFHDHEILPQPKAVAKAVNAVGDDIFIDLMKVKRADKRGQIPKDIEKGIRYVDAVERLYFELKEGNGCFSLKSLAISGRDLLNLGFSQGREVGIALKLLLDRVLEEPSINEKQYLTEIAKELLCGIKKGRL